ncbi:MAG: PQQ-dependent sugar dehydrogenase [Pseudomonadota bacterium]
MLRSKTMVGRALFLGLITSFIVNSVQASQFGRQGFSGDPGVNSGANCTVCHAAGATKPVLTLTGPENVIAGNTYTYEAILLGGPGVTAGFSASTGGSLGTLLTANSDLRIAGDNVSHAQPKPLSNGQVSFTFRWTAPSFNTQVTLYGAGNSSDGQLDLLGDGIATQSLSINVTGGTPPPPPPPAPPAATARLDVFATGLDRPVVISHAGDQRLFVVEQAGQIRIVDNDGSVRPTPFLDIRDKVEDGGNEEGLLGLAFHPDYDSNGYFYVNYIRETESGPNRTRIARFRVTENEPNVADTSSELVILEFEQPYSNHNGGDLHFGPDGYLYIASGDGGSSGDPRELAQNPSSLLGKLLRLDVGGVGGSSDCALPGSNYQLPEDNAFNDGPGGEGCDEIWGIGLRNPWRFSFDRLTGDLWIGDVGQNNREEINFVSANTSAGLNFGWRCYEGDRGYTPENCDIDPSRYFFPIYTTWHGPNCSITGGMVYRGAQEPALWGRYFFTDVCNTAIVTINRVAGARLIEEVIPAGEVTTPVAFGENNSGELFLASLSGTIYQIRSNTTVTPPIGEAGEVTVAQSGKKQWHTVMLQRAYDDPIVVIGPPSFNGTQPTSMRVRNVNSSSFQFQIDEWDYLDQAHIGETVAYMVVERGTHDIGGGRKLSAGRENVKHLWKTVSFDNAFSTRPVVIAQITSKKGRQTVTERIRKVSIDNFQMRLQEEEANDGSHTFESVDWIAVEPGEANGVVVGHLLKVSEKTKTFNFLPMFDGPPLLIAEMQTMAGRDPATPRLVDSSNQSASIFIQEERSGDSETRHNPERVGYILLKAGMIK